MLAASKMRLVGIADLHGKLAAMEKILQVAAPVDAVLLAGDITHFGTPEQAEQIVCKAQESCPHVFAVAGNCDSHAIGERLANLGVSVHARGAVVQTVGIHGLAAIPTWKSGMYQMTEEQLSESLSAGLEAVAGLPARILLTHVPPFGTSVDRAFLGRHCGSRALRDFVEAHRPCLLVCGHIHESVGIEQLGSTTVVNCGPASRGSYAVVELTIHSAAEDVPPGSACNKVHVEAQLHRL